MYACKTTNDNKDSSNPKYRAGALRHLHEVFILSIVASKHGVKIVSRKQRTYLGSPR